MPRSRAPTHRHLTLPSSPAGPPAPPPRYPQKLKRPRSPAHLTPHAPAARLWLGISGIGAFVLLAAFALALDWPRQLVEPGHGLPTVIAAYLLLRLPSLSSTATSCPAATSAPPPRSPPSSPASSAPNSSMPPSSGSPPSSFRSLPRKPDSPASSPPPASTAPRHHPPAMQEIQLRHLPVPLPPAGNPPYP